MMNEEQSPIIESVRQLEALLRANGSQVDQTLVKQGQSVLAIYADPNFSAKYQNLKSQREGAIFQVIDDLANGAALLKGYYAGLIYSNGQIKKFTCPYGSRPEGNVIFSIAFKKIAAFRGWTDKDRKSFTISEEEMNASIYALIHFLAIENA